MQTCWKSGEVIRKQSDHVQSAGELLHAARAACCCGTLCIRGDARHQLQLGA